MLDFILSTNQKDLDLSNNALKASHIFKTSNMRQYFGDWGCLSIIGRAYPGFEPFENDTCILVILGGPLPRKAIHGADGPNQDNGTQWIFHKWVIDHKIHWEEDLVGHFAALLIKKHQQIIKIITDINSFIPIYLSSQGNTAIRISSHPDALAIASAKLMDIDLIALGDFLKYKTVTFPYTFYNGITQLNPSSELTIRNNTVSSNCYWKPEQEEGPASYGKTADLFRKILIDNVKRICHNQKSVGLLLSGGEDSRVVASIAANETNVKAVTFSGSINRETRLASKIAQKIGIDWQPGLRKPNHYFNYCDSSTLLSGSHNQFIHAHTNGLINDLPADTRILGGLMADAFYKCAIHYSRYKKTGKYIIRNNLDWGNRKFFMRFSLPEDIDSLVEKRRAEYLHRMVEDFPKTHLEWYWLRPSSMTSSMTNLTVNRRLFPSYEPFIDAKLFRLATSIPQEWKLNNKIFQKAMKPILHQTQFIFHTDGWLPYYRMTPFNLSLMFLTKAAWKFDDFLSRVSSSKVKNRLSWPVWREVVAGDIYQQKTHQLLTHISEVPISIQPLSLETRIQNGNPVEKMNVLQLLTWLNWILQVKDKCGA